MLTGPRRPVSAIPTTPPPIARATTRRRCARWPAAAAASRRPSQTSTPVVPPDTVTGRSLTLVITIMCFLACLTAGAVYMIEPIRQCLAEGHRQRGHGADRAARRHRRRQDWSPTPSLPARPAGHRRVPARSASPIAAQLLEPWLGQSDALQGAARAAPHRYRDRPQHAARSGGAARRARRSSSRASRSTIIAAGSSRSAP